MVGVLGLAPLTEMLQPSTPIRHAEISDIVHDLIGAICGLGLFFTYDLRVSGKWMRWRQFPRNVILCVYVVLVVGMPLLPVLGWAYAYWDRVNRFPSLLQFSSDWEMKFVRASDSQVQVVLPPMGWKQSAEDRVGPVTFYPKRYSGIRLDEPYPDGRGFSHFQLDIFSELSMPQSILIRIDDSHHNHEHANRFNRAMTISTGLNYIQIPLDEMRRAPVGREMDLRSITRVVLFAVRPVEEFSLYLDTLRLQ